MLRQSAFHSTVLFVTVVVVGGRSRRSVEFEVLWAEEQSWVN
jgi:hypothetical protein